MNEITDIARTIKNLALDNINGFAAQASEDTVTIENQLAVVRSIKADDSLTLAQKVALIKTLRD